MGFPRQECWSGLIFPPPRDLPDPGIEPMSLVSLPLAGGFFTTERAVKPILMFAAAAAKSLQLCPTLCDPIDSSPPGSSIHGIFQARVLEWGAIAFSDLNAYLYLHPMSITLSVPLPSPHQSLQKEE